MRVLITGGTGFVGGEVVRQALASGCAVRLLARNSSASAGRTLELQGPVEWVRGDILKADGLVRAVEGCDAVIHLVGIISEFGRQTFENAHVRATQNILAAAKAAGVKRHVQMSALGTRPDAVSRYHQTKWAAESSVRASGLAWTILRPSLIFGPEDHFVNLFARIARWSPVLPVMGAGTARLQPVAVENVAACFVRALAEPRASGQTLDICGPDRFTLPQILREILAATGRRRALLRIPLPLARVQAAMLERLYPLVLRRAPPLNRDQLLMLQEDNVGDPQPARDLFGLNLMTFREGIRRYLPAA